MILKLNTSTDWIRITHHHISFPLLTLLTPIFLGRGYTTILEQYFSPMPGLSLLKRIRLERKRYGSMMPILKPTNSQMESGGSPLQRCLGKVTAHTGQF